MTETVSNVFDIACPSPLALQELSSLAIVGELWQEKIRSYHRKCKTNLCDLLYCDFPLEEELPNMPRRIYDLLEKYVNRLRDSLTAWLCDHDHKVFRTGRKGRDWNEILSIFNDIDIALDWNGTIHYVRTAKRMLLCDRIDIDIKFRIACLYCFEDDIKRIWPSVCTNMDLNKMYFCEQPRVYFWICLLRNELHELPNLDEEHTDKMTLSRCESENYSCAEYFFNRIPLERQSQTIIYLSDSHPKLFCRYILPKLNEPQLVEFLAEKGDDLIYTQLAYGVPEHKDLVIPTWMYIRNKISEKTFIALIQGLLSEECKFFKPEDRLTYQSEVSLCCEIWNSASQSFKQAVFNNVLPNGKWFFRTYYPKMPRETRFLMTVLSDASFEERSAFWHKHWRNLMWSVCVEDLLEIMKMCFRNENEMTSFKENVMSQYENIKPCMSHMMHDYAVYELKRLLAVCVPDTRKRMELKQQFLNDPDHGVSDFLSARENFADEFLNDTV